MKPQSMPRKDMITSLSVIMKRRPLILTITKDMVTTTVTVMNIMQSRTNGKLAIIEILRSFNFTTNHAMAIVMRSIAMSTKFSMN